MEQASYWRHAKRTSPPRITTEGNDLKQQTAPHNHAVDVVDTQVKAIQSDIRKRAGKKFLYSTIHIYYCKCDQVKYTKVRPNGIGSPFVRQMGLDQMGLVHLLLDEMGLDQMGLDTYVIDIGACRALWVPGQDLAMPHLMCNCGKHIISLLVYRGSSHSVFLDISTHDSK